MRVLITGFGPFPGVPRNPSARLAASLASDPRLKRFGLASKVLVLPTTYSAISDTLLPALAPSGPEFVLMLGVAARRRALCIETRAQNRASRLMPDASGHTGLCLMLDPDAPSMRHLPLSAIPLLTSLRGVPARLSRDAGRYLCNAAWFAALGQTDAPPALFIHVPLPERRGRPTLRAMHKALLPVVLEAVRQVRCRARTRGQASASAGR